MLFDLHRIFCLIVGNAEQSGIFWRALHCSQKLIFIDSWSANCREDTKWHIVYVYSIVVAVGGRVDPSTQDDADSLGLLL